LVLESVQLSDEGDEAGRFLRRRAETELEDVPFAAVRSLAARVAMRLAERSDATDDLVDLAVVLEENGQIEEAETVLAIARSAKPERADLALRAGRLARLLGKSREALELYGVAGSLDGRDGHIGRLAAIGAAVLSDQPERDLSAALRRAIRGRDGEAAGVALEERARVRRLGGDRIGAMRDLLVAAVRYDDSGERGRVAHQLADLLTASDDPHAARHALLFALEAGDHRQRDHARARLHGVSRQLGDQLGMRRWRSYRRPGLVSISPSSTRRTPEPLDDKLLRMHQRIVGRLDAREEGTEVPLSDLLSAFPV
jgi:tetratricopeptide (TPR) repeat protein